MAGNTTDFTLNHGSAFPENRTSLSSNRTAVGDDARPKSSRSSIFSSSSRTSTLSPLTSLFRKKQNNCNTSSSLSSSASGVSASSPSIKKQPTEAQMAARASYFAAK